MPEEAPQQKYHKNPNMIAPKCHDEEGKAHESQRFQVFLHLPWRTNAARPLAKMARKRKVNRHCRKQPTGRFCHQNRSTPVRGPWSAPAPPIRDCRIVISAILTIGAQRPTANMAHRWEKNRQLNEDRLPLVESLGNRSRTSSNPKRTLTMLWQSKKEQYEDVPNRKQPR